MRDQDFDQFVLALTKPTTRRGAIFGFVAVVVSLWKAAPGSALAHQECDLSLKNCSGTCSDTFSDPRNCGSCGVSCHYDEICSLGRCRSTGGESDCAGGNGDLFSDPYNCGKCGYVCPSGAYCNSGFCQCPQGLEQCGHACVDTFSDRRNCGACGVTCSNGAICYKGDCGSSTAFPQPKPPTSPDTPTTPNMPNLGSLPEECFTPEAFIESLPVEIQSAFGLLERTDGGAADTSSGVTGHAYKYVTSNGVAVVTGKWVSLGTDRDINALLVTTREEATSNGGQILEDGTGLGIPVPVLLIQTSEGNHFKPENFFLWGYEGSEFAFSLQSTELEYLLEVLTELVSAMKSPNVCGPGIDPEGSLG